MCGIATSSKPSKSEQDYRAEDDFRTLQRAEEVRGDKDRHTRAQSHGRKQISAMSRVLKPVSRGSLRGKAGRSAKR